jgi:hypothetical protein
MDRSNANTPIQTRFNRTQLHTWRQIVRHSLIRARYCLYPKIQHADRQPENSITRHEFETKFQAKPQTTPFYPSSRDDLDPVNFRNSAPKPDSGKNGTDLGRSSFLGINWYSYSSWSKPAPNQVICSTLPSLRPPAEPWIFLEGLYIRGAGQGFA